jgi:hypothetical protein
MVIFRISLKVSRNCHVCYIIATYVYGLNKFHFSRASLIISNVPKYKQNLYTSAILFYKNIAVTEAAIYLKNLLPYII